MASDERLRTNIEDALRAYFSCRKEVVAAFLFGSHARNRQRPGSDVDVGVLLAAEASSNAGELRTLYTVQLGGALRKDVHTVIMNTAGEELLRQILSRGKCVHVNDERSYTSFRMVAYCRIADFDRYRKMAQRGLISRLKHEVRGG